MIGLSDETKALLDELRDKPVSYEWLYRFGQSAYCDGMRDGFEGAVEVIRTLAEKSLDRSKLKTFEEMGQILDQQPSPQ